MIILDSIHKIMAAYISESGTSKEMYDKLINMFRANNETQVLFFKNQLKNLKKGRDESFNPIFWSWLKSGITFLPLGKQ